VRCEWLARKVEKPSELSVKLINTVLLLAQASLPRPLPPLIFLDLELPLRFGGGFVLAQSGLCTSMAALVLNVTAPHVVRNAGAAEGVAAKLLVRRRLGAGGAHDLGRLRLRLKRLLSQPVCCVVISSGTSRERRSHSV